MKRPTPPRSLSEDQATVQIGSKPFEALWAPFMAPPLPTEAVLVAKGFKSTIALATHWGITRQSADAKARNLFTRGVFERAEGRVGVNRARSWFYRPILKNGNRVVTKSRK